jgi:hypothetical protein
MSTKLNNDEWLDLLFSLEKHHAVFYKIWQVGKPVFTEDIETAAVQFDKVGNFVTFLFNPKFWDSIDHYNKLFVICHECLHLVLNHGVRIKDSSFSNRQACNQCLDVVVNHLLVEGFDFDRKSLINGDSYCWVDTVFPDHTVSTRETFEYYYDLFEKVYGDGSPIADTKTVDDHSSIDFDSSDLIKDVATQMSKFDKESLSSISKHAGLEKGGEWAIIDGCSKVKQKWETVIKNWSLFSKKIAFKDSEQWSRLNRRLSAMQSNLMLPSELEVEDLFLEKNKIRVSFFLDSSGSCWGLKERFFQAALSLDPKTFTVDLYCFDTDIYKVDAEDKRVFGGGGTAFSIIERHLQNSGENYPDGVFVVTDGYGDRIHPEFPNKWHWFLTENAYTSFVPKESNVYQLAEFE